MRTHCLHRRCDYYRGDSLGAGRHMDTAIRWRGHVIDVDRNVNRLRFRCEIVSLNFESIEMSWICWSTVQSVRTQSADLGTSFRGKNAHRLRRVGSPMPGELFHFFNSIVMEEPLFQEGASNRRYSIWPNRKIIIKMKIEHARATIQRRGSDSSSVVRHL